MDKEDIHAHQAHSGILLSHEKKEIISFATNIDGPRDYHTK